ncbi:MAG: glycosyltransferase family 4 protein [Actinomycetota bacterium]|nr:glycosyltransferase family 4 protein [Actinomycetota bacterium]
MPTLPARVALTLEQCWHRVPGGTAIAALGMARSLSERDDVEVVGVAAAHRSPAPSAWTPPIEVRHLKLPRVALYESWHRLRRPPVESATGAIGVIHATTMAMPPRTAPVVMTVHDLAFLHDPSHFTPRGLRFFRRGLDLALREADAIVCPSETTRRDCERAGFDPGRLRVIPLGVDVAAATPEQVEAVRRRHQLAKPYVLWTGTIEPRKNLPRLLEAFRSLDADVELALAGPKGWNEDLAALLAGLEGRVRPLGFVAHSDLGPLYAGAEVFCFPSLLEGFGFPVIEAMAQGTPVVTSRGTSTEELAGGAGVLIDPRDPASIADGLRSVLEDATLAANLAEAGRERATKYSWGNTAEGLTQVYREVAA